MYKRESRECTKTRRNDNARTVVFEMLYLLKSKLSLHASSKSSINCQLVSLNRKRYVMVSVKLLNFRIHRPHFCFNPYPVFHAIRTINEISRVKYKAKMEIKQLGLSLIRLYDYL